MGAKEHCICWRQDAALTGTLGGGHPGCQSMRLPAACFQGRDRVQLHPPVIQPGPALAAARRQATTEVLNISFAITPSDTFVTEPVISIE
jgi:hypothetical protein